MGAGQLFVLLDLWKPFPDVSYLCNVLRRIWIRFSVAVGGLSIYINFFLLNCFDALKKKIIFSWLLCEQYWPISPQCLGLLHLPQFSSAVAFLPWATWSLWKCNISVEIMAFMNEIIHYHKNPFAALQLSLIPPSQNYTNFQQLFSF